MILCGPLYVRPASVARLLRPSSVAILRRVEKTGCDVPTRVQGVERITRDMRVIPHA